MDYRYRYLKWNDECTPNHPSNKYICPQCGKRTFVRVVDTETGELLPENVGKCDRVNKCGYSYSYGEFFAQNKEWNHSPNYKQFTKPNTRAMNKPICFIDDIIMEQTLTKDSDFREYMIDVFGVDNVTRIFNKYKVGADDYGNVIFWQIDIDGKVRGGKIMKYDRNTGHRIHDKWGVTWHHSTLIKQKKLDNNWKLYQTLFGSHLVAESTQKIALVESEKTALICSILLPEYIWLATGGIAHFNENTCQPLKGRDVIIYPDLGAYSIWEAKAVTVARQVGFRYSLSDILERVATPSERAQQLDIADYLTNK